MNEAFQSDLTNFDLVVLGGGLAGITAARQAARSGMVTALVCNQIGGNYLHKGCMEARYLHENAKTIRYCASARHKGIVIKGLALDMIEMMRRKKDQIDRIESDMEAELRNLEETSSRIHVFEGIGRALPNGTMDVMDRHKQQRQITWQKLIVAAGSLPTKREFLEGFNEVLTDEEILNLGYIPNELTIMGEGCVACEIASIYSVMGSQVTIITEKNAILKGLDLQVVGRLEEQMKKKGIRIHKKTKPTDIYKDSLGGVHIELLHDDGQKETIICSDIYMASERTGNFAGLDALRLEKNNGKIVVDDYCATSLKNVYAIGDVTSRSESAYQAEAMARLVIGNITGDQPHRLDYFLMPTCIHSFPEIACIGLDVKAASELYEDVRIGLAPLGTDAGDLFDEDKQGFVKVVVDGQYLGILGVHIIGENAPEIIGQAQALMAMEGTVMDAERVIHPHPSLSQALQDAIDKIEK